MKIILLNKREFNFLSSLLNNLISSLELNFNSLDYDLKRSAILLKRQLSDINNKLK